MSRDEALGIALAYLNALGGDDPDAVAALVADDFQNIHQNALGESFEGRDRYRARLRGFFSLFPCRSYVVTDLAVDGGAATGGATGVEVVFRYRFRAMTASGDGAQVEIDIPGVMWMTVAGGLVGRRIDTWDGLLYQQQLGSSGSTC